MKGILARPWPASDAPMVTKRTVSSAINKVVFKVFIEPPFQTAIAYLFLCLTGSFMVNSEILSLRS